MTPERAIEGVDGLRGLVGQEAGVSGWTEVTQDMIDRFAALTGDGKRSLLKP